MNPPLDLHHLAKEIYNLSELTPIEKKSAINKKCAKLLPALQELVAELDSAVYYSRFNPGLISQDTNLNFLCEHFWAD